jgi:phospholipid-binding lipoprotein MlaA
MMFKKPHFLGVGSAVFFLACSMSIAETPPPKVTDPEARAAAAQTGDVIAMPLPTDDTVDGLSSYNRVVFHFNDTLDRTVLKPVATLYNKLIPRPLHKGITNFFSNIDNIPTIVNDVLQIKLAQALSDSWRLVVNSTLGLAGFIDVGSRIGLKPHHEDFGLTLARWGYKQSNYFVVPFFGPGTIRDVLGWPVDYFFFSIYPHISNTTVRYGLYGVGVVDRRSNLLQYQDVFEQVAVDRYVFMRNAYLQHRNYQIEENEGSTDSAAQSDSDSKS